MTLHFETAVQQLMTQLDIGKDRAEAIARANPLAVAQPKAPIVSERDEKILEKEEQTEITRLFLAYNCDVRNLSQARASKQAPGIADLFVTHRTKPIAWWWESKRQVGGVLSPAQEVFRDDCMRCGVRYGTGDRFAAAEHLVALGLARRVGDHIEPVRA